MKRREFIKQIAGAAVFWPLTAVAQQSTATIGVLAAPAPPYAEYVAAVKMGLSEAGYVEGRNLAIEYRWAEGRYERLPALAKQLVERQVAVIVTMGGPAPVTAAMQATSTIPILFHLGSDPVEFGFVKSWNKPDRNVTGAVFLALTVAAKRLGLLHELVPTATTVGLLLNPRNPNSPSSEEDVRRASTQLGLNVQIVRASTKSEIDSAFAALKEQSIKALFVNPDPFFLTSRKQITELASRTAIAAVYPYREYADVGGLMSYGASVADAYRLAGTYAGRILKGENVANLPVQQSTKVELVINLRTAKALGLRVPTTLLTSADEALD